MGCYEISGIFDMMREEKCFIFYFSSGPGVKSPFFPMMLPVNTSRSICGFIRIWQIPSRIIHSMRFAPLLKVNIFLQQSGMEVDTSQKEVYFPRPNPYICFWSMGQIYFSCLFVPLNKYWPSMSPMVLSFHGFNYCSLSSINNLGINFRGQILETIAVCCSQNEDFKIPATTPLWGSGYILWESCCWEIFEEFRKDFGV